MGEAGRVQSLVRRLRKLIVTNRTPQQIADELNSLHARSVNIVEGVISGAAHPGGSITFTYRNPVDGQTTTATGTAWNQCSPSKVSALRQTGGSWIVIGQHESATVREVVHTDRRSRPRPETGGKIKVLFSVVEGSDRAIYIGGDRRIPKRIGVIPAARVLKIAKLSNAGKGDRYIVGLQHEDGSGLASVMMKTITGQDSWAVDYTPYNEEFRVAFFNPYFVGHGLWTQLIPNENYTADNIAFDTFSQYLGNVRLVPGGLSASIPDVESKVSAYNAIAPTIAKFSTAHFLLGGRGGRTDRDVDLCRPLILGKLATSAIYSHEVENTYPGSESFSQSMVLVNCSTHAERVLGGDMSWATDSARSLNLIGSQIYQVNLGGVYSDSTQQALIIPADQWEPTKAKKLTIDLYDLGVATTRRSIKADVYAIKPNAQVHSLSYHP